MQKLRSAIIALGILFCVIGGYFWWRAANPPLTSEQQIAANLNAAESALKQRSAGGILRHFAPEFSASGTSRDEFSSLLKGTLFQWRDVKMRRSNELITINGNEATSSGSYRISYRTSPNQPRQIQRGNYVLHWRRINDEWKVVKAEGAAPSVAE